MLQLRGSCCVPLASDVDQGKRMASFTIVASRRLGLETCEFDVSSVVGELAVGELFPIVERGSLCEFIILSAQPQQGFTTLGCVTWLTQCGAFVGYTVTTRKLSAVDKKRYAKVLPPGLTNGSTGRARKAGHAI